LFPESANMVMTYYWGGNDGQMIMAAPSRWKIWKLILWWWFYIRSSISAIFFPFFTAWNRLLNFFLADFLYTSLLSFLVAHPDCCCTSLSPWSAFQKDQNAKCINGGLLGGTRESIRYEFKMKCQKILEELASLLNLKTYHYLHLCFQVVQLN
jgi:hypothetical protein